MTHYPITVWVRHSCPTPLTLALISADSLYCAAKAEKVKGAGQACSDERRTCPTRMGPGLFGAVHDFHALSSLRTSIICPR
jgi:hypothetical protein